MALIGKARCVLWAALVFMAGALAGCGAPDRVYKTQGRVFGTVVEVSIYGPSQERADAQAAQVLREFDRLHHKFHAWQPSMLTELNDSIAQGKPYRADAEMVALLKAAGALAEQSDGLFNPAIGRLIRLWGFQSSDIRAQSPAPDQIRALVAANPKLSDLRYDGVTISSTNRTVMIDLGGYAKGYALDRAAHILRAANVKAALVNVGGNLLAIGQPGERPWQVGIRDPRGEGSMATLELHDNEAVGTSGDYQRYFMKDGKRHPHIIDPRTGQTIDLVASVTIVTSGGLDAGLRSDGHSKPLFIAGPGHWQAMADKLGLEQVMLVGAQRQVEMTSAMRQRMAAPVRR
jgi:FAD:protein FMN transferase